MGWNSPSDELGEGITREVVDGRATAGVVRSSVRAVGFDECRRDQPMANRRDRRPHDCRAARVVSGSGHRRPITGARLFQGWSNCPGSTTVPQGRIGRRGLTAVRWRGLGHDRRNRLVTRVTRESERRSTAPPPRRSMRHRARSRPPPSTTTTSDPTTTTESTTTTTTTTLDTTAPTTTCNHGADVSKVAHEAPRGHGNEHGKFVSAAAHQKCNGTDDAWRST